MKDYNSTSAKSSSPLPVPVGAPTSSASEGRGVLTKSHECADVQVPSLGWGHEPGQHSWLPLSSALWVSVPPNRPAWRLAPRHPPFVGKGAVGLQGLSAS